MEHEAGIDIEIDEEIFLPCYRHLLDSNANIDFIWGGRDSGKSHFSAQDYIKDCLNLDYFRCILIKKTYSSIKESQFQAIKDIIYEWQIEHLFHFKENPLEIHCINGNKFIARGCDDVGKLKSITNPSHAWIEEGNQLSQSDFITISTTLRSNRGKVKTKFTFNPEPEENYLDFWLYKDYFENIPYDIYQNFTHYKEVKLESGEIVRKTYTSTHTTYRDNPYVTNDRKAELELLTLVSPYFDNVYNKGLWGSRSKGDLFAFNFKRDEHCKERAHDPNHLTYLSFDFNRNPIACGVIQYIEGEIRVLKAFKLANSDIYQLCLQIKTFFPDTLFLVTGDASGTNGNAALKDKLNYYKIIQQELKMPGTAFRVPASNPLIKDNQVLVNALLVKCPIAIHPKDAYSLVYDLENVRMYADGSIIKGDREDPAQQADSLDWFRYWCNTFAKNFIKFGT